MPSSSGTVFVNYANRNYVSLEKLLNEEKYYTFSMHGNKASMWNRNKMHANLGYQRFYSENDYEIDESQYTVKQDCKVDVYIKIKGSAEANDAVYFGFPVEPKTYSYQINSGDKTVIPETAKSDLVNEKGEKYGIQYQIGDEDIELNKGDIIKFYEESFLISS